MKKIVLNVMISLLLLCTINAQNQSVQIKGIVYDAETNIPLQGAHVHLQETFYATTTNAGGHFAFENIKPGNYNLKVSYVGYQTYKKNVFTETKEISTIHLIPSTITTEEIVITASRAESRTPGTHQTISGETLREISMGQDLPILLNLTPSIVSTSDAGAGIGYTGLRIRGTDISRINVTINGVPLNDPESHGVFWVNMPDLSESVDNIQIQRGVGTSSNGSAAFGASINIQTTKLIAEPFAEINSKAGSYDTFANSVRFGSGLINGRWAFDGRLSGIHSDGYIDRASSDLKSFFFNSGLYGEKNIFRFTMMGGNEKTYQAWGGVPKDSLLTNRTFNSYTYENETDNYQQNHFHMNFMRQHNKKLAFNITAFLITGKGYYEQYKEDTELSKYGLESVISGTDTITESDIIQQKHLDNVFYGINIAVNYNSLKKLKISTGGSANHYTNDHFGKIIWMEFAKNTPKDYKWYYNIGKKTDLSAFIKINYQLNEKIIFFGDVLFRHIEYTMNGIHDDLRDLSQSHTFDFFNPKGGIFIVMNSRNELYASVATAGREPSRNNFRDADDNTVINPEQLIDYEAGYNLKLKNLQMNTNIYFMNYTDQLVLTGKINNVGDPVMVNVPNSYRAGIEIVAALKLLKDIELNANLSISRNKISNFTEWVDDWDTWTQVSNQIGETNISFSPSIISSVELCYTPLTFLQMAFSSKYVGSQYIDNTSSDDRMLNAWFVNNMRITIDLPNGYIRNAQLRFSVMNLFNSQYESDAWVYRYISGGQEYTLDGYFPQAGRHFMLGLNLKF